MTKKKGVDPSSDTSAENAVPLNVLAIDTSTTTASACIIANRKILCESVFCADRTLSARLVPEIERMAALSGIAITDIDLFAASIGPGSFTGVRGGVASIQGMALACGKPCIGFSTLAALAMNFSLSSHPVCSMIDARKSEVYAGLYDCSEAVPLPLVKDCVMPPADLLELIHDASTGPVVFAGDGALLYREKIVGRFGDRALIAPFQLHIPRASNGALLALEANMRGEAVLPFMLLPVYLRASEAEINRNLRLHATSSAS